MKTGGERENSSEKEERSRDRWRISGEERAIKVKEKTGGFEGW